MAGMKFTADIDVEGIIKLRQEINKLKNSLKAVAGIPNSDAAIKQLEKEIEAATKKLEEYENKYLQIQKLKHDIDSSNDAVKKAKKETAALQYTNKWIVANTEAVIETDKQIKQLKKSFVSLSDSEKTGSSGTGILRQVQQLAAQRLVEEESIRRTIKAQKDQIIQSRAEEGSITALRKQIILLTKDYDDLGRTRRNGDAGKALLAQIANVQKELSAAEQASGRFQRNVGNYASAWNGLSFSVQQVARELPSLAVSANTFFLAISNNLPILVDEIAKARKEYAAFKAEIAAGNKDVKAVAPVWQQLTKSLISWQTALVVGLTLLSVYGKEIISWISSLGKTAKAIKNLYTVQRDLYNVTSAGIEQSSKEITKLNSLYKIATDVTKSTKERNNAVKELKKSYPEHLKNLSDEKIKNGEVSKAIKEQTSQIVANAKATAAADQIAKNWYKSFQAGVSKNIAYITKQRLEQELAAKEASVQQLSQMRARPESYVGLSKEIEGIKDKIKETDREIKAQENLQDSYQKSSNALEKLVTVSGLGGKYEDPDKNYNSIVDQQKKISELLNKQATERKRKEQDLENQLTQSRIDAMAEGEAKIHAQRELDNKKEIQDLERQREDYIRTEIELQRKAFDEQESLREKQTNNYKKKTFDASTVKVDTSAFDKIINNTILRQDIYPYQEEMKYWNEYLKEYGTFQQKKAAINEEYNLKISEATTKGAKKSLEKEKENKLKEVSFEELKSSINFANIFGNLDAQSTEALVKMRDNLKEVINKAAKDIKPTDLKALQDAFKEIDLKITVRNPLGELKNSADNYRNATSAVIKAQEDLNTVIQGGEVITKVYR